MTLIKSMLLGSAAAIVAVAGAQAADLPTHKAAPVQYVQICNVGGIVGWVLPGSDTCMKISGYMTAQFTGGNLSTEYNWGSINTWNNAVTISNANNGTNYALFPVASGKVNQRVLVQANDALGNSTFYRNATGWSARANISFDAASNTAYGPLLAHMEVQGDIGNGFDSLTGPPTQDIYYVNQGYITWAGITAGKAASFFSFTGGGDNWANFFSPDRKGWNEPILMAYTASFGGGFSATLSFESPGANGQSGPGTQMSGIAPAGSNLTFGGQRWPDIVGALHVKQGWGEAQISGLVHDVNVNDQYANLGTECGVLGLSVCNSREQKTGWALDAGVKVNLPSFGAGDDFLITGEYGQSATWYSGLTGEGMWGEWGQTNGNGQPMYLPDAYFNAFTNQWSVPTTWSVSALLEHHFTPQFYIDLEGSIGGFEWSNMGGGCYLYGFGCGAGQWASGALSPHGTSWIIGADLGWNPVTNLNFDLELMYQSTTQAQPSGFLGTVYNAGFANQYVVPGAWEGNSSGFAGRFRVTRYF